MGYRSRNDLDSYRQDIRHHPDDEAEVKRRLDGPCSVHTPRMFGHDAEPLDFKADCACPYPLEDDRPMPVVVRIVGGAVLATVLLGCVLVVAVRWGWL